MSKKAYKIWSRMKAPFQKTKSGTEPPGGYQPEEADENTDKTPPQGGSAAQPNPNNQDEETEQESLPTDKLIKELKSATDLLTEMVHYADGALSQNDAPGAIMAMGHVKVLLKKELKDTEEIMKLMVKNEKDTDSLVQKMKDRFSRKKASKEDAQSEQKKSSDDFDVPDDLNPNEAK